MNTTKAVEGFVISYLADGYSPKTMDGYQRSMMRQARFLDDPDPADITVEDIRNFLLHLRQYTALSQSSIQVVWRSIRSFYNWASQNLKIARPDKEIPMPKASTRAVSPLSEDEIHGLLNSCEYMRPATTNRRKPFAMKRPSALRDKALLLFLLDTGVRVGECVRMRLKDGDQKTGEAFVKPYGSGSVKFRPIVYQGFSAKFVHVRKGSKGGDKYSEDLRMHMEHDWEHNVEW